MKNDKIQLRFRWNYLIHWRNSSLQNNTKEYFIKSQLNRPSFHSTIIKYLIWIFLHYDSTMNNLSNDRLRQTQFLLISISSLIRSFNRISSRKHFIIEDKYQVIVSHISLLSWRETNAMTFILMISISMRNEWFQLEFNSNFIFLNNERIDLHRTHANVDWCQWMKGEIFTQISLIQCQNWGHLWTHKRWD